MSISYATFKAGNSKIQFYPARVLGFMTSTWESEIRFAVFADGRIMQSAPVARRTPAANYFTAPSWTPVDSVPDDAEFIGHYSENLKA